MNNCFSSEVFGVDYDEVWVSKLNHPLQKSGKEAVLDKKKKLKKLVIDSSVKLDAPLTKRVAKLLSKKSYDNGKGDVKLQLFSFIFLKDGNVTLTITPNILGGDLYSTDTNTSFDPRSFSAEQKNEFLMICYLAFATKEVKKGTPIKIEHTPSQGGGGCCK
jgi:hypothetical protein